MRMWISELRLQKPLGCLLFCSGPDQLLSVGTSHIALPGTAGVRTMSCVALHKQTFWNQHGGHNGCRAAQFTSPLFGNTRKGKKYLALVIYMPAPAAARMINIALSEEKMSSAPRKIFSLTVTHLIPRNTEVIKHWPIFPQREYRA